MCSFRISRDGPAVIPCLGPRSRRRPRTGSVKCTYDGEISKRITDPNLIKSLSKDTRIKIKPPQTGDKLSQSSQSSSPRFKNRQKSSTNRKPRMTYNLSENENAEVNEQKKDAGSTISSEDKNVRYQPTFPKYNAIPYRPRVDKPELDENAEMYMNGEFPESDLSLEDCQMIKSQLKKLRSYYVQEREYSEALEVHQKLIELDGKIWELDHYTDELYDMRNRMRRHQEIEQIVKIYLDDWEASYEEFLESVQLEADQIEEKNRKELEEFDSQIPQELTIRFRKPSKKLIDIRNAERRLALDNQINFAMRLKKAGDQIEEEEARQAFKMQKKLINDERKLLIKHQEERIKVFYDHINTVRNSLVQQRDKLIQGYLFRLNDLDKKLDKDSQDLKVKVEEYCNSPMNDDRLQYIKNEELGVQTPKARPGVGYSLSVRNRLDSSCNERKQSRNSKKSSAVPVIPNHSKISKKNDYR